MERTAARDLVGLGGIRDQAGERGICGFKRIGHRTIDIAGTRGKGRRQRWHVATARQQVQRAVDPQCQCGCRTVAGPGRQPQRQHRRTVQLPHGSHQHIAHERRSQRAGRLRLAEQVGARGGHGVGGGGILIGHDRGCADEHGKPGLSRAIGTLNTALQA